MNPYIENTQAQAWKREGRKRVFHTFKELFQDSDKKYQALYTMLSQLCTQSMQILELHPGLGERSITLSYLLPNAKICAWMQHPLYEAYGQLHYNLKNSKVKTFISLQPNEKLDFNIFDIIFCYHEHLFKMNTYVQQECGYHQINVITHCTIDNIPIDGFTIWCKVKPNHVLKYITPEIIDKPQSKDTSIHNITVDMPMADINHDALQEALKRHHQNEFE